MVRNKPKPRKPNTQQGSGNTNRPKKRKQGTVGTPTGGLPAGKAAPSSPSGGSSPSVPAPPTPVSPFFTPADLTQINDYITAYATSIEDIDNQLANLKTDTDFETKQNDKTAKENTSAAADAAAGNGIFQSSIKDATLYDLEAQRQLSNKFLTDKLTSATLQAGTRKKTLGDAKKRFDEAMAGQQVQNASTVNDAQNTAYANATVQPTPAPAAPAAPAQKPYTEQPGSDSKGNPGTWHIYPNGRRVFVRK